MVLFINACVRDESRTERIARALLKKLGEDFREIRLEDEGLQPLDKERLQHRDELITNGALEDEMFAHARDFAKADTIVIAAPYWDLSFPASLKVYLENIYVTGIVSRYSEEGIPVGMCKAGKLYYVTTAGGPYCPDYSYGYLETMAKNFLGIPETELIYAQMLDVIGFDAEKIVEDTIANI